MKMKFSFVLSILIVLSILMVSCGKDTPEITTPVTSDVPQSGGTLTYGHNSEIGTLDCAAAVNGGDRWVYYGIYDSLVTEESDGTLWPDSSLAESWEYTTPTTIIFHLRQGVKFHDGTNFDAEAVKFNYERMQNPDFRGGFAVPSSKSVKEIEVIDTYTLKFELEKPNAAFLTSDIGGSGRIASPTAIKKYGDADYSFNPSGTGPYKLSEVVPSASATLVRNENYWKKDANGNQLPYLDTIKFVIMLEEATRIAALETGKIDMGTVPLADRDRLSGNANIEIYEQMNCAGYGLLLFNTAKAPMDNVNLRRAMSYAIDPNPIVEGALFGGAIVADAGMWTPDTWVYDNTVPRPYYSVDKAKEYLKAGGKPDGFKVDVVVASSFPENMRIADIMVSQWAKIGIDATIKSFDVTTAGVKYFEQGEIPVYISVWARRIEPSTISGYLYRSNGYFNAGKTPNSELDELIDRGVATYDQEERKDIYRKINEIVLGDSIVVPMTYSIAYVGYVKDIKGMDLHFDSGLAPRWEYLWRIK